MSYQYGTPWYIIDGYNVIFIGGYLRGKRRKGAVDISSSSGDVDAADLEDARYNLLRALSFYGMKRKVRLTIVWDGGARGAYPRSETRNRVQNIYTPTGMSADEQIVHIVEKLKNPRGVTVVSDDRKHIIDVVRNLGAQSMNVAQFLERIEGRRKVKIAGRNHPAQERSADIAKEKKKADDLSVEEWLRLFRAKK